MAKSVLSDAHFHSEAAAFAYVEAEIWPNGPVCPHCGATAEKIGRLEGVRTKPSKKNPEGVERHGLRKCYDCREQFTVRVGTIFEESHLPLRMWLQAIHLLCASKKGFSTRQLQRTLNCSMKTAWHLSHRIRHAMDPGSTIQLGGAGKTVEADETAITNSRKTKHARSEVGTVEGTFDHLDSYRNHPAIAIIERRTNRTVWCLLNERLQAKLSDKATYEDFWKHSRVFVNGIIKYDKNGAISVVEASDLRKIQDRRVSLDDIRDRDFTSGLSVGEYLNRLRDGTLG